MTFNKGEDGGQGTETPATVQLLLLLLLLCLEEATNLRNYIQLKKFVVKVITELAAHHLCIFYWLNVSHKFYLHSKGGD